MQKLKSVKEKIESDVALLETKLRDSENYGMNNDQGKDEGQIEQKVESLKDKARRLSFIINRIEGQYTAESTEDLLQKIVDIGNIFNLVQATYGPSKGNESGSLPDKVAPARSTDADSMAHYSMAGLALDIVV